MNYIVIAQEQKKNIGTTLDLLATKVNQKIAEGYLVSGGVSSTINAKNNNTSFYQGMVKP